MVLRRFLFVLLITLVVLVLVSVAVGLLISSRNSANVASLPSKLARQPGVVSVETRILPTPKENETNAWVVHLLDNRFVPEALFVKEARASSAKPLSDADVPKLYKDHLDTVEKLQSEHAELITWLAQQENPCIVFVEGLTPNTKSVFPAAAGLNSDATEALQRLLDGGKDINKDKAREIEKNILGKLEERRRERLELGAAARVVDVKHVGIWALDENGPVVDADPGKLIDQLVIDPKRNKERELAMAKRLAGTNLPLRVALLGGDHDLAEALLTAAPGLGYMRVQTQSYRPTER